MYAYIYTYIYAYMHIYIYIYGQLLTTHVSHPLLTWAPRVGLVYTLICSVVKDLRKLKVYMYTQL